jgi:hypothetical protein
MRKRAKPVAAAAAILAAIVVAPLAALGVVPGLKGRYANGDPELAVDYRAKETCSCLWVLEREEAYCRAWTEASPDVARVEVDAAARIVRARALVLWTAQARFVDARSGCVLE